GQTATDTFQYTVTDNNGASSTKTATVTIHGQNDAPVAVAISQDARAEERRVGKAGSYSDADASDTHTFTVDTTGTHGLVSNNRHGSSDYNPSGHFDSLAAGQTATDTFQYTVTDNNGASSTKTATVTIHGQNDAPVAVAISQDA